MSKPRKKCTSVVHFEKNTSLRISSFKHCYYLKGICRLYRNNQRVHHIACIIYMSIFNNKQGQEYMLKKYYYIFMNIIGLVSLSIFLHVY